MILVEAPDVVSGIAAEGFEVRSLRIFIILVSYGLGGGN